MVSCFLLQTGLKLLNILFREFARVKYFACTYSKRVDDWKLMLLSVEEISVHFPRRDHLDTRSFWGGWSASPRKKLKHVQLSNASVLHRLSLTVEKNDFLAILGPSGSGKTTLLRTIAGLTIPNSGRIVLNGTDITFEPPHRRDVSLVFQNGGWYDHLTVGQHFKFDGLSREEVRESLLQLDLLEVADQQPAQLSGGQSQRLAIGRALARNRSVLLLDEPLSQLDQSIRESLRQRLRSIHAQGRTLVYVTHDQMDAMLLATKIAVLYRGKIQQIGPPNELFEAPNHRCVAEMLGQPAMQFFEVQLSGTDVSHWATDFSSSGSYRSDEAAKAIHYSMLNGFSQRNSTERLQIGIRPVAWRIAEHETTREPNSEKNRICFTAVLNEERFMGHQRLLQFKVCHSSMPAILVLDDLNNSPSNLVPGEEYEISTAIVDLHWFDPATGDRISAVFGQLPCSNT